MKIYKVGIGSYKIRVNAVDGQHARTRFANEMSRTEPNFPYYEHFGMIKAEEIGETK